MPTSIEFPIETTLRNINTPKAHTAANTFYPMVDRSS